MKRILWLAMLSCVASTLAMAQDRLVSGKVTDSAGDPVIGAAVMLKDGSMGAVTDSDGNFSIEADESDVLVVQSLGYETVEIPVGVRSRFSVILEDAVHLLDDVVVTGYQTLSKERATGSFDIIDKAQIQKPFLHPLFDVVRIGAVYLKLHQWMDFPKFCHFLGKIGHIPGFSTANSYLTSQFFIPILKFLLCFFRQSHNLLCPPLQKHAVICQRHMVFSTVKKLNSQFFLQLDQLPGKRGLCDVKEPGCLRNIFFPRYHQKIL